MTTPTGCTGVDGDEEECAGGGEREWKVRTEGELMLEVLLLRGQEKKTERVDQRTSPWGYVQRMRYLPRVVAISGATAGVGYCSAPLSKIPFAVAEATLDLGRLACLAAGLRGWLKTLDLLQAARKRGERTATHRGRWGVGCGLTSCRRR
jgi:hypothetical protein